MADYRTDLAFHYDLLELLARRMRPELYVGLGIGWAECMRRVAPHCTRAIGVDITPPPGAIEGFEFFHGTSTDFLANVLPQTPFVELALIDADHRHEASLQDFESLLPCVKDNGVILLHDTYPENMQWLSNEGCGDTYRTAEVICRRADEYGVEAVTLPTPPGVTIVRKRAHHLHWLPIRRRTTPR
jgi:hypothetical protein